MKLVIVESPFKGETNTIQLYNTWYGRLCLQDSLMKEEAPFASHLLYTQECVLDDSISWHRKLGMRAGFAWGAVAELVAVYTDLGVSPGMTEGIERHKEAGLVIEHRLLPEDIWGQAPWTLKAYADRLNGIERSKSER